MTGPLVLGGLELKGQSLILSVNSQDRADRGRALLSRLLHGFVGESLVEIQSLDQVMASDKDPSPPLDLNLTEDERRALVHQSLDRHYREMLDQPAPLLGNKSQRAAAKTAKGRVKVADWLKLIENYSAKSVHPSNAASERARSRPGQALRLSQNPAVSKSCRFAQAFDIPNLMVEVGQRGRARQRFSSTPKYSVIPKKQTSVAGPGLSAREALPPEAGVLA